MLSPFKNFFHYSKSERKGSLFLLLVLIILLFVLSVLNYCPAHKSSSHNKYLHEFETFNEIVNNYQNSDSHKIDSLFIFNPNTISIQEWQLLGFSSKQAESIEKYKAKGSKFYCKQDVLKLFVVDETKFQKLHPFIDLPECTHANITQSQTYHNNNKQQNPKNNDSTCIAIFLIDSIAPIYNKFDGMENLYYTKRNGVYQYFQLGFNSILQAQSNLDNSRFPNANAIILPSCKYLYSIKTKPIKSNTTINNIATPLELNTADSISLITLNGVWPALASRIIQKRKQLGGFLSVNQLFEVYGFTENLYQKILPHIYCDTTHIHTININIADINQLKNHPYIDYKVANSIFWMRKNHGLFKNINDIKKSDLINDELFSKIAPYLKIE